MHRNSRTDLEIRSSSSPGFTKVVKNGQNAKGLQAIKDDPETPEKHVGFHSSKKHLCHLHFSGAYQSSNGCFKLYITNQIYPRNAWLRCHCSQPWFVVRSMPQQEVPVPPYRYTCVWVTHLVHCLYYPSWQIIFFGGVLFVLGWSFNAKDKQTINKSFVFSGSWVRKEKKIMTNLPAAGKSTL